MIQCVSMLSSLLAAPIQPTQFVNIQTLSKNDCKTNLEELINKPKSTNENYRIPLKNYHSLNWNWFKQVDSSDKQMYSNDSKSVCLHPFCSGCFKTDGIRGEQAIKRNAFTYWQVEMSKESLSGTSTMIGIGNINSRLNSIGYLNLIGMDENSWGLSNKGYLWHNNKFVKFCDQFDEGKPVKVGCLFDGFSGRLSFFINGKFTGVAFENIPLDQTLYPMVSSTVTRSVFKIDFAYETFPTLQEICRSYINQQSLDKSTYPQFIIDYLNNY